MTPTHTPKVNPIDQADLEIQKCGLHVRTCRDIPPRCMTARDRLRAWDVNFLGSSNLTHKSCGIFVASWGFAHCIGTRLVFHNFLSHRKEDEWNNAKKHEVLKIRLLILALSAFIRGSLEPQRLLIQIWQ